VQQTLTRLARDARGNTAIFFALAIIPLIMGIGVAVDLSNATRVRLALQDATDSAVLAMGRDGMSLPPGQLQKLAEQYMNASYSYNGLAYAITKASYDKSSATAELNTRVNVPTTFMGVFGKTSMPVTAHAVSKGAEFEIAMVLDNSGSMAESAGSGGAKIKALREASKALVETMFASKHVSERVKIGIVPFAASVNVGADKANASWIDKGLNSSIQAEDFDNKSVNRDALWAMMQNASWAGCVMQRPAPHDLTDAAPAGGDTLFVKWFAPDEPDWAQYPYQFANDYLPDAGGDCTGDVNAMSAKLRQARTCKYKGVKPTTSGGRGPNFLCTTRAVTPLTNIRKSLDDSIDAMQASGNTNILEGLLWGWRVLSPTEPFTEGKAYGKPNNRKIVILMTDGENFIGSLPNFNSSYYTAFGYASQKRIGNPVSSSEATNRARVDAKTLTACGNVKAKDIVIYTIAFGSDAKGSAPMLKACATDPTYFYAPQNSNELKPVFLKIADSINRLRIAQ
jgi:Flp pilus assembly protein TadG